MSVRKLDDILEELSPKCVCGKGCLACEISMSSAKKKLYEAILDEIGEPNIKLSFTNKDGAMYLGSQIKKVIQEFFGQEEYVSDN